MSHYVTHGRPPPSPFKRDIFYGRPLITKRYKSPHMLIEHGLLFQRLLLKTQLRQQHWRRRNRDFNRIFSNKYATLIKSWLKKKKKKN